MKLLRWLSVALVLTLAWTAVAAAAAMLRTAPFPGDLAPDGVVACYVANTGPTAGKVSATLYDLSGTALGTGISDANLPANATISTGSFSVGTTSPTRCVCAVPSTTTFRCSFVFFNKDIPLVSVIGAP